MRVLIIGASVLLGQALPQEWTSDEVFGPRSQDCDVRDQGSLERVFSRLQPAWTVLAAAYTHVDGCEKDSQRAYDVNLEGATNVAEAARTAGTRLLFLSTAYVFDGAKTTPYETDDAGVPDQCLWPLESRCGAEHQPRPPYELCG